MVQPKPAMDVLQFIASVASSLAWPGLIVLLVAVFRRQLIVLADRLAYFEGFGVKFDFGKGVEKLSTAIAATEPAPDQPVSNVTPPPPPPPPLRPLSEPHFTTDSARSAGGMGSAEKKVDQGWDVIEEAIRDAAAEVSMLPSSKGIETLFDLEREGIISPGTAALVRDARTLRNAVVVNRVSDMSFFAAQQFLFSAQNIAERIRREALTYRPPH